MTSTYRAAPIDQPILERALVQTLFLYGMVLIPLVWFTRRLADPLRALAAATTRVGTPEGAPPVPEAGPDDVRGLAISFNAMQDRIRSMLEEKDHMLGAIGHDLRTPLTALRVRVESVPEGADRDRMIATIDDMRQMLDDILALARIGRDASRRRRSISARWPRPRSTISWRRARLSPSTRTCPAPSSRFTPQCPPGARQPDRQCRQIWRERRGFTPHRRGPRHSFGRRPGGRHRARAGSRK